jgi:hypothetical protein
MLAYTPGRIKFIPKLTLQLNGIRQGQTSYPKKFFLLILMVQVEVTSEEMF